MLYCIIGKKGCGKTALMTYLLKKCIEEDKKIKIFSTYKLDGIAYQEINFKKLFKEGTELENCIIALDEAYLFADCRSSSSTINKMLSYVFYQTRKANVTIFLSAVKLSTLDKRLREDVDALIFPSIFIDNKKVLEPEKLKRKEMLNFIKNGAEISIKGYYYTHFGVKHFSVKI